MEMIGAVGLVIGVLTSILSLGTAIFLAGKWAGMMESFKAQVVDMKVQFEKVHSHIEAIKTEAKDDRHEFRAEMQRWQQRLWDEIHEEQDKFEAKMDKKEKDRLG